jgi:hypothetical protein
VNEIARKIKDQERVDRRNINKANIIKKRMALQRIEELDEGE